MLDRGPAPFYNTTMRRSFHHIFSPFALPFLLFFSLSLSFLGFPLLAQEAEQQAEEETLLPIVEEDEDGIILKGAMEPDLTLKRLYQTVNSPRAEAIDQNSFLVISGVVSAREVLQPKDMGFIGLLEITIGEWKGTESVERYRCYVQLEGEHFSGLIPEGRSRNPDPREIALNQPVLVFGTYIGFSEDGAGKRYPVLLGQKVRKLSR